MKSKNEGKRANCIARRQATPGRNGYTHRQQYGIVVICDNEEAQQRAYARLQRAGFSKLRVVVV